MLERLEQAFAQRKASEERLRQFLADASHELRTPLASIRGYAELFRMGAARDEAETRDGDAPDRGRVQAHGRARRGPAHARAPGRGARARPRAASIWRRWRATRSRTPARWRPIGAIDLDAPDAAVVSGDSAPAAPGARQPACATRSCTRRRGTPIEVSVVAATSRRVTVSVRDHGPGLPDADRRAPVRSLLARRGRARARPGRRRARPVDRRRRRATPTAGA